MAGRYSDWARVQGDTSDPSLLNLGRKLLGDLDTRRRLGGIEGGVLVQEAQLPDGRRVRARYIGNQPIVEISVPERVNRKKVIPLTIEGFVARPSPDSDQWENVAKNHVLMQVRGADTDFTAWFFNDGYRDAAGYDEAPLYARIFPDGIGRYGNVDWINADASVVLSWMGPSGRYFGATDNPRGAPWVFLHGQVLFDFTAAGATDALADAIPAPVGDLGVRGACVRLDGLTSWLYVAARDESTGEYLLRYRLQSPVMRNRLMGAGLNAPVHLLADCETDYASGELLLAATTSMSFDGVHPYYFNTDGTEARRLYDDSTGTAYEVQLVRTDEDPESWARNVTTYTASKTEYEDASRALAGSVGSWERTWDFTYIDNDPPEDTHTEVQTFTGTHEYPWDWDEPVGNDGFSPIEEPAHEVGEASMVSASSITGGSVPSADTLPFAVDFKAGAWVYAHMYLASETHSSTLSATPSVTGTWALEVDGDPNDGWMVGTDVISLSYSLTIAESRTGVVEGFRTDFIDVPAVDTMTHEATITVSYAHDSTQYTNPAQTDTYSATNNRSATDDKTSVIQGVDLLTLDLRHDLAYYYLRTTTTTVEAAGGATESSTTTPIDDFTIGLERTITETMAWDTRLIVNGVLLHSIHEDGTPSVIEETVELPDFVSNTGMGMFRNFFNDSISYDGGFVDANAVLGQLSVEYMNSAGAPGLSWHCLYGNVGPEATPTSYSDSDPVSLSYFPPMYGGVETHRDYVDDTSDNYGSWALVKDHYVLSHQQPEHRNGEGKFALFSSLAGVDTLRDAHTGAVRMHPVGYISKTIVAVSAE